MVCNKNSSHGLIILGVLTSLILSLLSFVSVPQIYEIEYVLNLCLGFLVVMVLLALAGKRKHLENILLLFSSISILNILYVFLFKPSLFLLFNFVLSFTIFSCALSTPKKRKSDIYTIEKAYEVRDFPQAIDAKIIVEDSKGNETDIETAIKNKLQPKTVTTKKKPSKKTTTKKSSKKKK